MSRAVAAPRPGATAPTGRHRLLAALLRSVVNLGLVMPALEHMTGQTKDFGQFDGPVHGW